MSHAQPLSFYLSPPEACSYLPARDAVNLFADPLAPMDTELYGRLIDHGFRRSGRYVYRPQCGTCKACVPSRIAVSEFKPNRSQQRNLKRNQDLDASVRAPRFRDEHFALYQRYQDGRHPGGGMDNPRPESYRDFLICDWTETLFVELRLAGRTLAVAVTDLLPQGLSAVYTFFDPEQSARGLGTYAVLWQIREARRRGLPYVYLGYWIAGNRKMRYKTRFRPIEGLVEGRWRRLPTTTRPVEAE
jgi:arginyl-tRNA--protein-N-Asp/Glu arginylyltransferase